jgi:hypothetical protein
MMACHPSKTRLLLLVAIKGGIGERDFFFSFFTPVVVESRPGERDFFFSFFTPVVVEGGTRE